MSSSSKLFFKKEIMQTSYLFDPKNSLYNSFSASKDSEMVHVLIFILRVTITPSKKVLTKSLYV